MPNVNMVNEMVDMMMAARAYEANLSAMNTSRDLLLKTLTIGKP
jgi:flagellar basal-body rod protein FlgC